MISLTESNADLQKIVAFENAFERLLAIIDEEGAVMGGIIVQDCLQLVQNLLRYNVSNQVWICARLLKYGQFMLAQYANRFNCELQCCIELFS